jgi:hypothetical protein
MPSRFTLQRGHEDPPASRTQAQFRLILQDQAEARLLNAQEREIRYKPASLLAGTGNSGPATPGFPDEHSSKNRRNIQPTPSAKS